MRRAVFLVIRLLPIITIFGFMTTHYTFAQELHFNSEITYNYANSKTELKTTGEKIRSNNYLVQQRYNLNLSKRIYPYLEFNAGTFFEWDNSHAEAGGTSSETEQRTLRPFVGLNLTNPLYQAGVQYRRTEINDVNPDATNTESIRDEVDTVLAWRPEDLPQTTLNYNYTHSYDHPKTEDTLQKLLQVQSTYSPWRALKLDYIYTRTDTEDRVGNFDTLDQTHFGRINYAQRFWHGRLSLNGAYNINYDTLEFPSGTGGSTEVSLQRSQGLFSLDNTPQDGPALAVNNALIDGNVVASAGIDLGLNGNQTTLANIGLDFGLELDVDQIRLWVDRTLSNAVADSFSWSVYVSPDNTNLSTWTLVATVFPASFGTFENRFEINFPTVKTRFIKVVTSALSPVVPGANNFPNIFVTEMQAFVTVSQAAAKNKTTTTNQNANFGCRVKLSENTSAGYNMNYIYQKQDPFDIKNDQLSNAVFMNHILNRMFSTGATLERTDTSQNNEDTTTYKYSTFVRGVYLPTLNQTLTFSGENIKEEDDSSDNFSVILRSNATLYRGWSAFLDSGFNYNRPTASDEAERSVLLRVGTNFEPNQMLSFNVNYRLREIYKPENRTQAELTIETFFVPTRSLSFNASYSVVERENTKTNTYQNYVVTWSPSPDGDLQFFFTYTETLTSEPNERQTNVGPGFNWTISSHFFLETSYNYVTQKTNTQKIETHSVFAKLRMIF